MEQSRYIAGVCNIGEAEIAPLYGPGSPTAAVYKADVARSGFKDYIRSRDRLFEG